MWPCASTRSFGHSTLRSELHCVIRTRLFKSPSLCSTCHVSASNQTSGHIPAMCNMVWGVALVLFASARWQLVIKAALDAAA
jgi:hypothetical protein